MSIHEPRPAEPSGSGGASALEQTLFAPEARAGFAQASRELGETLRWSQVLRPLLEFCRDPRRAPDLIDPDQVRLAASTTVVVTKGGGRIRQDLALLREYHREGGVTFVWANVAKRVRRVARAVARRVGGSR